MAEIAAPAPVLSSALSPSDLAELMSAFNDVTSKLHATHEQLTAEVARLTGELRSANEQIERSRRLAALGEMAAGIAHEVRNPLGSIGLYARMLLEDLHDRPPQRDVAGRIAAAVRALDAIVGDVLSFAREVRLSRQPASPGELFDRALEFCGQEAVPAWRDIIIHRTDHDSELVLEVDHTLVQQALVNVIRNAFEAIAQHGGAERAVTLSVAKARSESGVACAALCVRDTGPGVSDEVVQRMFNPFFTTRATGTGLGLAIVHRIVDAHGGSVRVRNASQENTGKKSRGGRSGAVIELLFPCAAPGGEQGPVEVVVPGRRCREAVR